MFMAATVGFFALLAANSHPAHQPSFTTSHPAFVLAISNTATRLANHAYDSCGKPRNTGKLRDAESGLDFFEARYYSSVQGRFTSPDEWAGGIVDAFTGGQVGTPGPLPYADISDPQTINKYVYVRNNPMRYTDPDGHCFLGFDYGAPCEHKEVKGSERYVGNKEFVGKFDSWYEGKYGEGPTGDLQDACVATCHTLNGELAPLPTTNVQPAHVLFPVLLGMTSIGLGSPVETINGNSASSPNPQHRYIIQDGSGDVVKTGISGLPLNQNGTSPRANPQVNRLNAADPQGGPYRSTIVERNIPGRAAALGSERAASRILREQGNTLRLQKRPNPNRP